VTIMPHQLYMWRDQVRDPTLTLMLIVQCLVIFIAAPCADIDYPGSRIVLELLFLVVALLIILISRGVVTTSIAVVAMIATLVGTFLTVIAPSTSTILLAHMGTITGAVVVAYVVGSAVFASGLITSHRVLGAVVLYLNFGLLCTTSYRLIWDLAPNSFTGIPEGVTSLPASGAILYFSFVTLTSVGYGDIVPLHPFARALSNLEAITGQLYPATILARLVTLQLQHSPR
jgi:ion channel